jgi:small ligand-binding sensory domain FIST
MADIWHLVCQSALFDVINGATQTPHGQLDMTALLLSALVAAVAANVALVPFVADRLSPKSSTAVVNGGLLASNENFQAITKMAA